MDVSWQTCPSPCEFSGVLQLDHFLSQKLTCSGRTRPVPHFGPPTAPRRTASAALAQARVSSGRGLPVASIAHPPINLCWNSIDKSVCFSTNFRILIASAVTSGPTPSPSSTQTFLTGILIFEREKKFERGVRDGEVSQATIIFGEISWCRRGLP